MELLEYVFFDERPRDQFVEYLAKLGLEPRQEQDDGLYQVFLPEELEDETADRIEQFYDEMLELSRELYEAEGEQGEVGYHAAGITVELGDGRSVYAEVEPRLLGRIMEVLSPEEFNEVVNAIVEAVENPDARSLGQRMRDADA